LAASDNRAGNVSRRWSSWSRFKPSRTRSTTGSMGSLMPAPLRRPASRSTMVEPRDRAAARPGRGRARVRPRRGGTSPRSAPGRSFVALETDDRLLAGRAVDPPVGDMERPPEEVPLQGRERVERSAGQGVVLHIADAAFDLPLGARASGATGPRRDAPILAEG